MKKMMKALASVYWFFWCVVVYGKACWDAGVAEKALELETGVEQETEFEDELFRRAVRHRWRDSEPPGIVATWLDD